MTRTGKNILWNTVGSTMFAASSIIMLMLVSRAADVSTVGAFGISLTNAQLLYIVGIFGASHYQMTDFNKRFGFADYYWLKIITCGIMALLCVPVVLLSGSALKALFTILLTAYMLLNSVGELYQSLFFQNNRIDLTGQALFYRTFFSLCAYTAVLLLSPSIVCALLALVAVNILCTWNWGGRRAGQFVPPGRAFDYSRVKSLLKECFPLFVSMFLMLFLFNVSKYSIELLLDDEVQGYFNMLFIPAQVINLCSQFIFRPMLSRYASLLDEGGLSGFRLLLFRQAALVCSLTAAACLAAYLLGPEVLGWLYQAGLLGFRAELVVILAGGGVFALCQLCFNILVIMRRQTVILRLYIAVAVAAGALSFGFVSRFGIMGASYAFVVSHVLLLCGYGVYIYAALLKRKRV